MANELVIILRVSGFALLVRFVRVSAVTFISVLQAPPLKEGLGRSVWGLQKPSCNAFFTILYFFYCPLAN